MLLKPKTSFLGWFTRQGRLKNRWARALNITDPQQRISKLRLIWHSLSSDPQQFGELWLPFLEDYFDNELLGELTEEDFSVVEAATNQPDRLSNSGIPVIELWLRLIPALDERGEKLKSNAVLRKIFHSSAASRQEKQDACLRLIDRKAKADSDFETYVAWLKSLDDYRQAPQVINFLTDACDVSFESANMNIKRAGIIASKLKNAGIDLYKADIALGLYKLQVETKPADAIPYFTTAFEKDPGNMLPLTGLITAWVQNGEYEKTSTISEAHIEAATPLIRNLLTFSQTMSWLNSRSNGVAAPIDADTLEELNLSEYIGDVFEGARGRLFLIEGNASKAAEILLPLAQKQSHQPEWQYYAAWAAILTNQSSRVLEQFKGLSSKAVRWPVACLLLDADPATAKNNQVKSILQHVKGPYGPAGKVRLALAEAQSLPGMSWQPGVGTMEEDLEALRTVLGFAFARENRELMKKALASPLLLRLPRADQLFWSGLYFLLAGENAQAQKLLQHSSASGMRRASLVLSVHFLNLKQLDSAEAHLKVISNDKNIKYSELISAYLSACRGKTEEAVEQLEKLRSSGDSRIYYALGNIYLDRSREASEKGLADRERLYLDQAIGAFRAAMTSETSKAPDDCQILLTSTQFVVDPDAGLKQMSRAWSDIMKLTGARRQRWVVWNAILAQLWSDHNTKTSAACEEARLLLEELASIPEATAKTISQAAAFAGSDLDDSNLLDTLVHFVQYLAGNSPSSGSQEYLRVLMTMAARQRLHLTDKGQQQGVRNYIGKLVRMDPANIGIGLFQVSACLADNDMENALASLASIQPENDADRELCTCLHKLLLGERVPLEQLPEIESAARSKRKFAVNILQAPALFLNNLPEQGYNILINALNEEGDLLVKVIDIEKFLPALCAHAASNGFIPKQLVLGVRKMIENIDGQRSILTVARCAAAIDEFNDANHLWKKVLKKDLDPHSSNREEFVNHLCYQAVKESRGDTVIETITKLRFAAETATSG